MESNANEIHMGSLTWEYWVTVLECDLQGKNAGKDVWYV